MGMDPKLFEQRLRELAQIKPARPPRTAESGREATVTDSVWRNGEQFEIDKDNNPTLSWEIVKLHPQIKPCESCGLEVEDRTVEQKRCEHPVLHWRRRCSGCRFYQHPETGEFSLTSPKEAQGVWTAWLTQSKSRPRK